MELVDLVNCVMYLVPSDCGNAKASSNVYRKCVNAQDKFLKMIKAPLRPLRPS